MTKQQITIEVDVPEGWEVVGWQVPLEGDHFLNGLIVEYATCNYSLAKFIVRKAYQFPTWTSATWLAMDKDGVWSFFQNEPQISDDFWFAEGYSLEVNSLLDFTPPPCTDWRQSKRRRPT